MYGNTAKLASHNEHVKKMEDMRSVTCAIQFNSIDKMCSEVSLTFHTRET